MGANEEDIKAAAIALMSRCRGGIAINHDKSKFGSVSEGFKFVGIKVTPNGLVISETRGGEGKVLGTVRGLINQVINYGTAFSNLGPRENLSSELVVDTPSYAAELYRAYGIKLPYRNAALTMA